MKKRVVVTGLGTLNAVGNTVDEMWEGIKAGKNGICPITLFDASNMKVKIAGEVKNLDVDRYLDKRESKRLDRSIILGLISAMEAFQDAQLDSFPYNQDRFGVFASSGIGGINTTFEEAKKAIEKGGDRVSPFFIPNAIINLIGGHIAIRFQAKGPSLPIVTACSASTNAIGEAFRYIRDGYLDLAFAGGAEAPINELAVGGFTSMKALNTSNDVNACSIPFDKRRNGFVIAEGAGMIMLEEYEHAIKRNAKIYAEVVGYATNSDAYHITTPDETAMGVTKCMQSALQDAGLSYQQIDYINTHGTSTQYNDRLETLAIKNVFHEYAYEVAISSTKSMTGHALGAVGGIEAIICIKALQENLVPPTINYQEPDPECDLNYTPNQALSKPLTYVLSNSMGFGGQNATVIFKKYQKE